MTLLRSLPVVLAVALALSLGRGASTARAAGGGEALDRMVRYLQDDQNRDGGFGGEPGQPSNPDFTAWVALALAAAGVNPRDQRRSEHGAETTYGYLTSQAIDLTREAGEEGAVTTDFERELLVVDATGTSPHEFGGVDLVGGILDRELQEPSVGGIAFAHGASSRRAGMNDTIFAVLALSPVHEPAAEAAVQQGATWIEHEQDANGSWPAICPKTVAGCSPSGREPEGEADMTAAAIEALNAAGRHDTEAQAKALAYLHATQNPTEGGFTEELGAHESDADSSLEANVGSTAWVVQAIWAAGQNPEDWKPAGVDPLTYLESMQQEDGHVRWERREELNGVWMTAYAGPAMGGDPLPIPAPAYTPPPPEAPEAAEAAGGGGESDQPGQGVSAGGGGDGAPLFSRPQPQSTGTTPGGVRLLGERGARPAKRERRPERRNPGAPRTRPAPTVAASAPNVSQASRSDRPAGAPGRSGGRGRGSAGAGEQAEARRITGVLVSSPAGASAGAPGLHRAGASDREHRWIALAIALAIVTLAALGMRIETRRPSAIS